MRRIAARRRQPGGSPGRTPDKRSWRVSRWTGRISAGPRSRRRTAAACWSRPWSTPAPGSWDRSRSTPRPTRSRRCASWLRRWTWRCRVDRGHLAGPGPLEDLKHPRTEFLGMVSHELRTPLNSIKGSAVAVLGARRARDPAEMLQFFRVINEQADQTLGLIADLLD
ncbi:MAG: hypothetical protein OXC19_00230 [Bryobacterales bacterium]|nr:hypothetical protein [Bryobacterales bacterium]